MTERDMPENIDMSFSVAGDDHWHDAAATGSVKK